MDILVLAGMDAVPAGIDIIRPQPEHNLLAGADSLPELAGDRQASAILETKLAAIDGL